MRGEESLVRLRREAWKELPPHARRRVWDRDDWRPNAGITSACAEKSRLHAIPLRMAWNYLRMRGEESVWRIL